MTNNENSVIGNGLRFLVLFIIAPYVMLLWGLLGPEDVQAAFEINEAQFYVVMAIAGCMAAVFTYVLRKVFLVLGVLAVIGFGGYIAFTSLGGESAAVSVSHSRESLRTKCVELLVINDSDARWTNHRRAVVAYCNDYYK